MDSRPYSQREFLEGPQCIGILPILHKSRKIKNPPKLRNSETPAQKLRNSSSETQKVRGSEFPSRTTSGSFGVDTKSPKHYVYSGRTHLGSFCAGFFSDKIGQLRNSASKTQKHKLRNWFSEFPSRTFRVSEVEGFPCREGPCRFQYIGATQGIPGKALRAFPGPFPELLPESPSRTGAMTYFLCADLFSRVLFSFLPPLLATPLPLIFSALFRPFFPSKRALFCRANGTAHSLERGGYRMDLCTKFGKEIPSRNLREKRSVWAIAKGDSAKGHASAF